MMALVDNWPMWRDQRPAGRKKCKALVVQTVLCKCELSTVNQSMSDSMAWSHCGRNPRQLEDKKSAS